MMYLLVITLFMTLFIRDGLAAPLLGDVPPAWSALASLGLMAAVWGVGHLMIWGQVRKLDRTGRARALYGADRAAMGLRIGAVLLHAFNVLLLGWLDTVRGLTGNIIAIDELLAVLPAVVVLAMSWWSMYPIERRLRDAAMIDWVERGEDGAATTPPSMPGRWAFVLGAVRHHLAIVLVPASIIMMWNETLEASARWVTAPSLLMVLQFAGIGLVLTMMPLVMRRVWDTAAMSPGPLREQITEMCRAHRVRVRELLVWRTHGTMVNGAVMGIIAPFRYLLLTDALIDQLHPRQVEAVTAHEVGHARRRHVPWLMGGVIATMIVSVMALHIALFQVVGGWVHQDLIDWTASVGAIVIALVAFGFASRRFEWQADAFAVQHLSTAAGGGAGAGGDGAPVLVTAEAAHAMYSALGAVAHLNHMRRDRFTWRHGSIASRQRRIQALIGQRTDRLRADREAGIVKILSAMTMIGAAAIIGLSTIG